MAATLANYIPFAFAMLDTAFLLVVLVFLGRGLLLSVLGRRAWKAVLIATTSYVAWANALLIFGLTGFNPGAYLIATPIILWNVATGRSVGPEPFGRLLLLVTSWVGVAAAPTLALAAIQLAAQRVRLVVGRNRSS